MTFVLHELPQSKIKFLPFIAVSKPIWYLEINNSGSSLITLSALSLIMISMLSLFECITWFLSVSLEDIKLIASVNWNFYTSKILKIINVSQVCINFVKVFFDWYSFIFITMTFIFNIFVRVKVTHLYCFIITIFFVFWFRVLMSLISLTLCFFVIVSILFFLVIFNLYNNIFGVFDLKQPFFIVSGTWRINQSCINGLLFTIFFLQIHLYLL